jgi:predicted ATPase/DNA-binding SARP family transcriptional activator/uncharacterized protein HemY
MSLRLRLFGIPEITVAGEPAPPSRTRKDLWLLAYLALRPDQAVDRAHLASLLWPDSDDPNARQNLRRSLMSLRDVLGSEAHRLQTPTRTTLRFDAEGAWVDVREFDRAAGPHASLAVREEALVLYRGPLLEGCLDEWAVPEREARHQSHLAMLESLARDYRAESRAGDAARLLHELLSVDPTRESAVHTLMETLAGQGDTAAVTEVYREFRQQMHRRLNTEPSASTTALYHRLRNTVGPIPPETASPFVGPPRRMPVPLTPLIGREGEITSVRERLGHIRLVTLTGTGGVGKTRLAIAVAEASLSDYPDGAWFADLAALTEGTQIAPTVASLFGVREDAGKPLSITLRTVLETKTLLLVLDNCEHLLAEAAVFAQGLLSACPRLRILATSREPLGVPGEQVYRVPSLPVPAPSDQSSIEKDQASLLLDYAAVRLFVASAGLARADFRLTSHNAGAVAAICLRLDGIPLAIELAAARVRAMSVEQINERLEDRFALLTRRNGQSVSAALSRHQTLRALVDWSHDLLSEPEQVLLSRLSVFAGGWTLEAAEAVVGGQWSVVGEGKAPTSPTPNTQHPTPSPTPTTTLDLLSSLVDKSLVLADLADEANATMRYRMLETVREYARERLVERSERQRIQARHRDYFLRLAEETRPKLHGSEQAYGLSVLAADHDNFRQALAFSLEEGANIEPGLRLGAALQRFWGTRGYVSEGRERLMALLSHPEAQARTGARADALRGAGGLVAMQGEYTSARSLYEESLSIYRELGDRNGIAHCLGSLGNATREQGDYASAYALYEESLAIYRNVQDRSGIAYCLGNLGDAAYEQGDYPTARSLYEEALALRRELGDRNGIAYGLGNLGIVAFLQGDYATARSLYEESLTIFQELGDKGGIATFLNNQANAARHQGDFVFAASLYEKSLALRRELGDKNGIAASLNSQGNAARDQGDYVSARSLYEESLAIFRELGDKSGIAYSLSCQGDLAYDLGDYASARSLYEESLALFQQLGDRNALAGIFQGLGHVAREQEDYPSARSLYTQALEMCRELNDKNRIAYCLEAFATLASREGEGERSVRLGGAAAALRDLLGFPLPPVTRASLDALFLAERASLGEAAFTEAWEAGHAMTWEQAAAYAVEEE